MSKLTFVCFFHPEVMKASQQAIERGVKDFLFIDYKRRSGHFDVTTVASIKEITEKVCTYVEYLVLVFCNVNLKTLDLHLADDYLIDYKYIFSYLIL